jgi:hypothetical protein
MHGDEMTDREMRLAAWLDGALAPAEAEAFAAELAGDPALARMADQWRDNDRRIVAALSGATNRPLPGATLALLQAPAANDNPGFWHRFRHGASTRRWSVLALGAVAAAVVAVVVTPRSAPLDPLSQALDRTPSLASATLPDGRHIEPELTVRAGDGRWCREYRDAAAIALACRDTSGRWHDEARGTGTAPEGAPDQIAVASGADDAALDPAFQRLATGDALNAKAEARLIAARWTR